MRRRVIYIHPPRPPTTGDHIRIIVSTTFVALLSSFIAGLILMNAPEIGSAIFGFFGTIFIRVTPPVLAFAGLDFGAVAADLPFDTTLCGIYSIFLFILARALLEFIALARLMADEIWQRANAGERPSRSRQTGWLIAAAAAALAALLVRQVSFVAPKLEYSYLAVSAKLGLFFLLLTFIPLALTLAATHRKINGPAPKGNKPKLKVVAAAEAPPEAPRADSFHIALAAELIQRSAKESRAPTADELAGALAPLRLKSLTSAELKVCCDRAVLLFSTGQLKTLKDVSKAKSLFKTPKKGAVDALANELQNKLTIH